MPKEPELPAREPTFWDWACKNPETAGFCTAVVCLAAVGISIVIGVTTYQVQWLRTPAAERYYEIWYAKPKADPDRPAKDSQPKPGGTELPSGSNR